MIPTLIENGVTIADLAKHLKTTVADVEQQCSELSVFVGAAWNGKAAISQREAFEMAIGRLREDHDHDAAWHAYREAAEQWTSARDEAYMDATRVSGLKTSERVEAGRAAARQFEEATPPPQWEDSTTPLAEPKYLSDGIFRRALDRLTGSVA